MKQNWGGIFPTKHFCDDIKKRVVKSRNLSEIVVHIHILNASVRQENKANNVVKQQHKVSAGSPPRSLTLTHFAILPDDIQSHFNFYK